MISYLFAGQQRVINSVLGIGGGNPDITSIRYTRKTAWTVPTESKDISNGQMDDTSERRGIKLIREKE